MEANVAEESTPRITKIKSRGQLLLCKGCCCGKTESGKPEVPVDRIKAAWKAEKLNKTIQLTISGCLGPCERPNVAVMLDKHGSAWLGDLAGDAHYDALIEWARASAAAGGMLPVPESLEPYRFDRFPERAAE